MVLKKIKEKQLRCETETRLRFQTIIVQLRGSQLVADLSCTGKHIYPLLPIRLILDQLGLGSSLLLGLATCLSLRVYPTLK